MTLNQPVTLEEEIVWIGGSVAPHEDPLLIIV